MYHITVTIPREEKAISREFLMIYRGPGPPRGRMIWLLPLPSPPLPSVRLRKKDNLLTEEGGGEGAKSYDCVKAWSSRNHSILSVSLFNVLFLYRT